MLGERTLILKSDGSDLLRFPLQNKRTVIGRDVRCDVRIPLPTVEEEHCEIVIRDARLILRDLGSRLGTHHNGVEIDEAPLQNGDIVTIGPVSLALDITVDTRALGAQAGLEVKPNRQPTAIKGARTID